MAWDGHNLTWRKTTGAVLHSLLAASTLDGVRVVEAAGRNGPGRGLLRWDGALLYWTAPGAGAPGAGVDVSAGGEAYLLGDDPDQWLRVSVDPEHLPSAAASAVVELATAYNNGVAPLDNVDLTQAPILATHLVLLRGADGELPTGVRVFLDRSTPGIVAISTNGSTYAQPYAAEDAEARDMIPQGLLIYVRIAATSSTPAKPDAPLILHARFDDGEGGFAYSTARGRFRIRDARGDHYRVYAVQGRTPLPGVDAPVAYADALPVDLSGLPDGDYRVVMTQHNGYCESGPSVEDRAVLVGGVAQPITPAPPDTLSLEQSGDSAILHAEHWPSDIASERPDAWALWVTTDGSTPGVGDPDVVAVMRYALGVERWRWELSGLADGVVVKALLKTRNTEGPLDSATGLSAELTIDLSGPTAPAGGAVVRRMSVEEAS